MSTLTDTPPGPPPDAVAEDGTRKFLTFVLDEQSYGLDIGVVTEIIGVLPATTVPEMPDHVIGVINLRGTVIPVMDVRRRFGLEPREADNRTCTIVVEVDGTNVGLLVDTVQEVIDIPVQDIDAPSELRTGDHQGFVEAMAKVGDEVKIVLAPQALLFDEVAGS